MIAKNNPDMLALSQDEANVYFVTTTSIGAITKATGKKTILIKNQAAWQQAVALVPYLGNLYLLDQKDGITKFVKSGSDYSQSSYFKTKPDLTKASAMAIDSSIWLLFSDGKIQKFTRGEADNFTIKNLEQPFNHPTQIYTDKDINNVYVLDSGNSRIVKLKNDGSFQTQYSASILHDAKLFEVVDKEQKILVLSNGKIWELAL